MKNILVLLKNKRRLGRTISSTALEDEEVKIFRSSQETRRNKEENPVDIFDFKPKSRDGRSCRWMIYDQEYSRGGRSC